MARMEEPDYCGDLLEAEELEECIKNIKEKLEPQNQGKYSVGIINGLKRSLEFAQGRLDVLTSE